MTPRARNAVLLAVALAILVGATIAFPRILAVFELAARQLRVFWWLVLILVLGVWLAFFYGKKRE